MTKISSLFESGIINYELSVCEYVLQTLRL
jgi:hypothetical protein